MQRLVARHTKHVRQSCHCRLSAIVLTNYEKKLSPTSIWHIYCVVCPLIFRHSPKYCIIFDREQFQTAHDTLAIHSTTRCRPTHLWCSKCEEDAVEAFCKTVFDSRLWECGAATACAHVFTCGAAGRRRVAPFVRHERAQSCGLAPPAYLAIYYIVRPV